jgi:hypothetical protein
MRHLLGAASPGAGFEELRGIIDRDPSIASVNAHCSQAVRSADLQPAAAHA